MLKAINSTYFTVTKAHTLLLLLDPFMFLVWSFIYRDVPAMVSIICDYIKSSHLGFQDDSH